MAFAAQGKLEAFARACRRVAEAGLVRCGSGNMSWRVGEDLMAVSATRAWLERLTADEVAVCRIGDGEVLNDRRPSVESRFHAGILRARPEVNVVLHFQSPNATALCCGEPEKTDFFVIIEVPYYIGRPAAVEYLPAGSPELAAAIVEAARNHDMILLKNHGQVVVGTNFDDAIQKAVLFELACHVIVHGKNVQPLSEEAAESLIAAGKTRDKENGGASLPAI